MRNDIHCVEPMHFFTQSLFGDVMFRQVDDIFFLQENRRHRAVHVEKVIPQIPNDVAADETAQGSGAGIIKIGACRETEFLLRSGGHRAIRDEHGVALIVSDDESPHPVKRYTLDATPVGVHPGKSRPVIAREVN